MSRHVRTTVAIVAVVAGLVVFSAWLPTVRTNPVFRLPFPCGQTWTGATRTNHNPPQAVDFNRRADFGDAVVASAPGTVTTADVVGSDSYGRLVIVGHRGGWETRYAHLSDVTVRVGDHVETGDLLGRVGSTGVSTGSHLHYEQRYHGRPMRVRFVEQESPTQGVRVYSTGRCSSAATSTTAP